MCRRAIKADLARTIFWLQRLIQMSTFLLTRGIAVFQDLIDVGCRCLMIPTWIRRKLSMKRQPAAKGAWGNAFNDFQTEFRSVTRSEEEARHDTDAQLSMLVILARANRLAHIGRVPIAEKCLCYKRRARTDPICPIRYFERIQIF